MPFTATGLASPGPGRDRNSTSSMPSFQDQSVRSPAGTSVVRLLAVIAAAGLAVSQAQTGIQTQGQGALANQPVIAGAASVTFDLLARAPFQWTYQADETRRFPDAAGNLVQVKEQLTVQGNGTESSPFQLRFVDLVGADAKSVPVQKWQGTYAANAGLLYMHGGFRVHDATAAARNYAIFDFGMARRANRDVRRVVVFPRRLDKAIWVVDLDVATGITLYAGEFDSTARLLGELEVTALRIGSQVPPLGQGWNWSPRLALTDLSSFQQASGLIRAGSPLLPAIGSIVPEYVLGRSHVAQNLLNLDQTLVFSYTDGVDEFFVSEAFGTPDPFAVSPMTIRSTSGQTHTIAKYDDPGMRVYVFHENGVTYQIVGRGSLGRLQDVARRICRQVVTGV